MRETEVLFKRTDLFPIDTSTKASESTQGIGEMGSGGWNNFRKTRRLGYDGFDPGFKTTLEHRVFAKGMIVERELMEDNQYPNAGIPRQVKQEVQKLGRSAALHREHSAANVFRNAFTDAGEDDEGMPIAGFDGVGLCSEAHPLGPENAATQSNEGTLALTADNLATTKLLMREFTDDVGELIVVAPGHLLVPPELGDTARIINETDRDLGTANNDVNPQKGRWKITEWDYLTDPNAWFMIDDGLKSEHLVWYDRVAPEFDSEGDFDSGGDAKYRGYYRFSRGWDAWQWIFGHNPA
jgi:hypothetical protein